MKTSTAIRAVESVITDRLQALAFNANLHDIGESRTPATIAASLERKRIIDAWRQLKQMLREIEK